MAIGIRMRCKANDGKSSFFPRDDLPLRPPRELQTGAKPIRAGSSPSRSTQGGVNFPGTHLGSARSRTAGSPSRSRAFLGKAPPARSATPTRLRITGLGSVSLLVATNLPCLIVPCHRAITTNGALSGLGFGVRRKRPCSSRSGPENSRHSRQARIFRASHQPAKTPTTLPAPLIRNAIIVPKRSPSSQPT